jgi:putative hydroxymethylpyrimidine transport system substrate-binding protein
MLARRMARPLALLALVAALAAAGCSRGEDRPNATATLVLDARPSAVDAGVELAIARDFDGAEGVGLRARAPTSRGDGLRRLLDGRAEFAVLDIHDLARARERGRDVVGVMAIVQRPLAAVLADPGTLRRATSPGCASG